MNAYLAFKALRVGRDLWSPYCRMRWVMEYVPALGRLTFVGRADKGTPGVHAATWVEACSYMEYDCRLFLVVPSPDPDTETELGTHGWRATCAVVLGEVTSLQDAARLVLASHQAGYPQVQGILQAASQLLFETQRGPQALLDRNSELARCIRAAASLRTGCYSRSPIAVVNGSAPPQGVKRGGHRLIEVGRNWPLLASALAEAAQ